MVLQVFEHQKLTLKSHATFTSSHLEALIRFNDKNQNKYLNLLTKRKFAIKFYSIS